MLRELVLGSVVVLVRDGGNRDRYERLLRSVEVDGIDVSATLIGRGVVRAEDFGYALSRAQEFRAAEQLAQREQIGCLWER